MNQSDLLQVVQRRGLSARTQRDEVLLESCIFCGNSNWNLELNADKGVFKCWACQESGRLQDLLRDRFNYQTQIPVHLEENQDSTARSNPITFGHGFIPAVNIGSAVAWLAKRHIKERDIRRYNIQVCIDEEHEHYGRIVFPLRNYWTGAFAGYNSRGYTGENPKYLIELQNKVPVGYRQPTEIYHIAVEGIFDAIRVHQAGYNALCLLGSGSNTLFTEWAATVPKKESIVLLLDGDEVGRQRADALKHIASTVRDEPTVLTLPETMDPATLEPDVLKLYLQRNLNV